MLSEATPASRWGHRMWKRTGTGSETPEGWNHPPMGPTLPSQNFRVGGRRFTQPLRHPLFDQGVQRKRSVRHLSDRCKHAKDTRGDPEQGNPL